MTAAGAAGAEAACKQWGALRDRGRGKSGGRSGLRAIGGGSPVQERELNSPQYWGRIENMMSEQESNPPQYWGGAIWAYMGSIRCCGQATAPSDLLANTLHPCIAQLLDQLPHFPTFCCCRLSRLVSDDEKEAASCRFRSWNLDPSLDPSLDPPPPDLLPASAFVSISQAALRTGSG